MTSGGAAVPAPDALFGRRAPTISAITIKPTTPPTTKLCLRRLFMAYLSNRCLFSRLFFWFFNRRDVSHERNSAPPMPKSHVFPKGPNSLICREMSFGEATCLVKLPGWHCRVCGSVPVLRHQLGQVGHHMEQNPDLHRWCTDHEQRFGNPCSYTA